jgi:hypothetical protein
LGERCRALELGARLVEPAELPEQVPANARQKVIGLEHRFRSQRIDKFQTSLRPKQHRECHRTIELDDRRRRELGKFPVEPHDGRPVGLLRGARTRVASRDARLQQIGAGGTSQDFGLGRCPVNRGKAAADEELIPACAILIEQKHRLSARTYARGKARRLDLHESDEAMDLRLLACKLGQYPAEAQRLLAKLRAHPVVADGG